MGRTAVWPRVREIGETSRGGQRKCRQGGVNDRHRGKKSRLNDWVRGVKDEERRCGIRLQLNE